MARVERQPKSKRVLEVPKPLRKKEEEKVTRKKIRKRRRVKMDKMKSLKSLSRSKLVLL